MLGVRFGAVCTIVLGGMLVSSAAHAAQACDQRFPRTCKPAAAQNSREAPKATSAQRAATTIRSRRVARHRQGVRHAQSARPARRTTESSVRPPIVPHVEETSPAARRFSEFVSPRLLAANPVEEFHKPRMNVSELSGQTAYPVVDRMEREPSAAAIDPARAAARDTFDELEPAEPARAANQQTPAVPRAEASAQPSANLVGRADEHDSSGGSVSWVRIVFLTWGGLLTVGSALRLLIG
ncbi:MAG: hypothetical protein E6G88_08770 [Alphaproteobacteria bacterium]|nr:MAG: hypothetical protein E6G88_08770 [Alphaproteobacteria bacterium]